MFLRLHQWRAVGEVTSPSEFTTAIIEAYRQILVEEGALSEIFRAPRP